MRANERSGRQTERTAMNDFKHPGTLAARLSAGMLLLASVGSALAEVHYVDANGILKTHIKNLLTRRGVASRRSRTMLVLITALGLILARRASAQTFTVLHSFTNSDGANPAGLIFSGSAL